MRARAASRSIGEDGRAANRPRAPGARLLSAWSHGRRRRCRERRNRRRRRRRPGIELRSRPRAAACRPARRARRRRRARRETSRSAPPAPDASATPVRRAAAADRRVYRGRTSASSSCVALRVLDHPGDQVGEADAGVSRLFGDQRRRRHARLGVDLEHVEPLGRRSGDRRGRRRGSRAPDARGRRAPSPRRRRRARTCAGTTCREPPGAYLAS